MSRRFASLVLPLLLLPAVTAAQTPSPLMKGQQVRVVSRCQVGRPTAAGGNARCTTWPHSSPAYHVEWTYTGQLVALDADTLRIRVPSSAGPLAVPTAAIAQVSVVDGTRSNTAAGAGIGLLAGSALGAIVGTAVEFCFFGCGPATGFGVIIGAPAGLLIGTVIGSLTRSDRWRSVSLGDHPIRLAPRRDALGVTLTMSF